MENHRELIAAVAGYVIGGTTMFIAFGMGGNAAVSDIIVANEPAKQTASVIQAVSVIEDVIDKEDGLFVFVDGKEKVVSIKTDKDVVSGPGKHLSVSSYELSPGNDKLFYCAEVSVESSLCAGFIYDAAKHSITVLKDNQGQAILIDLSSNSVNWVNGSVVVK